MKKRVLIISTSAGTGHVKAAEALAKTFAQDPRVEAVVHRDALEFTNKLFRDFYSKLYVQLIRSAPSLLGWVYKTSDEPWKNDLVQRMDRLNTRPLVKFIRDFRPDITVCTHFMPAGIIAHLISKGLLDAHLSIVVTDLDMHAMWLSRIFHRYFVAIDETRAHLEALGLPPERITVSGIPVDPIFAEPIDRAATRIRYGLDPAKTTLLLSAGALGVSPTEFVVGRLMQLKHDTQTVVVCGKNEELQTRMQTLVGRENPRLKILGYSDRMHELMKMSDLFIGKPGGLTTSEALASALPMIIISPIPGQEERNSDHLLEDGIALRCNELTTIPFKIDRLLSEPLRLDQMRRNAERVGRPNAARTIVETLLNDDLPPLTLNAEKREAIAQAAAGELAPQT
ncbi:MAG: processive 1,2-diacylglycerol beta-glucosyltransferase [Chthoniobacter sp.]|jgi:processive 1,2-diacylglycerol beta-glucosyltransferase|nr:processive 1,2-diacylglycerol beta-glucosyltransferase [Chthoniobacter sp.]